MERMALNVCSRGIGKGASRKLRREGSVPAVLYGVGRDPLALAVNTKELETVLETEAGWNILLDVSVEGREKVLARIIDYQADVLTRDLTHIDLQVLDLKKKIKAEVPLKLTGTPVGVKNGGILEVSRRTLEVRCLPTEIPEHIDADVTNLDVGMNLHKSDLNLPEGIEFVDESNFSVAAIVTPTAELTYEAPVETVLAEGAAPAEGEAAGAVAEGEAASADAKGKEPAADKAAEAKKK